MSLLDAPPPPPADDRAHDSHSMHSAWTHAAADIADGATAPSIASTAASVPSAAATLRHRPTPASANTASSPSSVASPIAGAASAAPVPTPALSASSSSLSPRSLVANHQHHHQHHQHHHHPAAHSSSSSPPPHPLGRIGALLTLLRAEWDTITALTLLVAFVASIVLAARKYSTTPLIVCIWLQLLLLVVGEHRALPRWAGMYRFIRTRDVLAAAGMVVAGATLAHGVHALAPPSLLSWLRLTWMQALGIDDARDPASHLLELPLRRYPLAIVVYVPLIAALLPMLVVLEDNVFRTSTATWHTAVSRSLAFGAVQWLAGAPLAFALLWYPFVGLVLTVRYWTVSQWLLNVGVKRERAESVASRQVSVFHLAISVAMLFAYACSLLQQRFATSLPLWMPTLFPSL